MKWLGSIARELWGLFVDDGLLAILALVWIAAVGFAAHALWRTSANHWAPAIVFAGGLLLILAESVTRAARKT